MEVSIFIFYFLLVTFLVTRIPFIRKSDIGVWWIVVLFSSKVLTGVIYGWFYHQPAYVSGADTWRYFEMSKLETKWLINDPVGFFKDIFTSNYNTTSNLFKTDNSYWNDLKTTLFIKMIALFNVITYNNYNADMVVFNFISFFGPIAIFRMCREKFHTNKLILIAVVFFIPSFIFWTSGLHKDGLLFSAISLAAFSFNRILEKNKIDIVYSLLFIFCFFILFALRNFIAIQLIPALIVWFLCKKYQKRKWQWIAMVYGVGFLLFFLMLPNISSSLDFPAYITDRHNEFVALGGNSQLNLPKLEASFGSFLSYFPYALDTAFLRPHIFEVENAAYLPSIIENFLFLSFFVFVGMRKYYYKNKSYSKKIGSSSFVIFCFCFALTSLLLTGYLVTLTGAIVRYRALYLPFIFAPLCSVIKIPRKMKNIH